MLIHSASKVVVTTLVMATVFVSNVEAQTRRARRPAAASSSTTATPTTTTATTSNVDVAAAPISNVGNAGNRRSPLNWDAFIDVKAVLPSKEAALDKGFSVNDAALYLAKDFSRASAVVDLPFSSTYNAGLGNGFSFAQQKAQAYVHMNFGALGVRLGQYDSFFGIEANDSLARFFANQGLLKGLGVTPMTHTGAQLVYSASRFTVRGQVANANSAGTLGSVTSGAGGDPEVGAQVRFDGGNFFGAAGLEYGTYRTNASDKTNLLVEVMGGMAINKFNIGAQLDVRKFAGASAGPVGANYAAADKTGFGLGLLGAYEFTDALNFGVRFDYLKDVNLALAPMFAGVFASTANAGAIASGTAVENAFLLSVGPSYKLDTDLTLRGDLSILNAKGINSDDTIASLLVSVVARL